MGSCSQMPGMTPDMSMATSSPRVTRKNTQKNVPFYYGYYCSKWGKLGEGICSSNQDTQDVLAWIRGGKGHNHSFKEAEKPILLNQRKSLFGKKGSFNNLDDRPESAVPLFTFGSKNNRPGGAVSPKTHLESDSNFENFLQKYDRVRLESHESEENKSRNRPGVRSDKDLIPKYSKKGNNFTDFNTLNDYSEPNFSADNSQDIGKGKSSLTNLISGGQKVSQGLFGRDQGQEDSRQATKIPDEYRSDNKRNSSFDMGKSGLYKDKAGGPSDSMRKSVFMDLDNLFNYNIKGEGGEANKIIEMPTPIKHRPSPRDDKETSLKNSIVIFEQELQNIRNNALGKVSTNWKSARIPDHLDGRRDCGKDLANGGSTRNTDLFFSKSSNHIENLGGRKSAKTRYFMSPLNLQKMCKTVQRVFQRGVFKLMRQTQTEELAKRGAAFEFLMKLMNTLSKKRAKAAILSLNEVHVLAKQRHQDISFLESCLSPVFRRAVRETFFIIMKHSLARKEPKLEKILSKLTEHGNAKNLMRLAEDYEKKMEILARLIKRKEFYTTQQCRRAFQLWAFGEDQLSRVALVRGSRKLESLIRHRTARELLRGYYGIKAAGGRLDKFFILVQKKQKIYTAQTKYCFKKLRIWNKFKSNVSEDYGAVKTIIIRTTDPAEEQKSLNLKRMFYRRAFESVFKLFRQSNSNYTAQAVGTLKGIWSKRKGTIKLLNILDRALSSKIKRIGWIELSIFDLQRKTVLKVLAAKKDQKYNSPIEKSRSNNTPKSGQNPLFKYFESKNLESREVSGFEAKHQSMSSDLEILRSGLDLDEKIRKAASPKEHRGAKQLEYALKSDNRFSSSPEVLRSSALRALSLSLNKLYKKRIQLAIENLKTADTRSKLQGVSIHYLKFGLERSEKMLKGILLRSKYEALKSLKQVTSKSKPAMQVKPPSQAKVAMSKSLKPAFTDVRGLVVKDQRRKLGY